MKKTISILLMVLFATSIFAESLEKIDFDGKTKAEYKGKVLIRNSQFKEIYKENNAEEALMLFNKGHSKVMWSFLPAVVGGGLTLLGYNQLSNGRTDIGSIAMAGTGVSILGLYVYLLRKGNSEKKESIRVYNNYVEEQNSVSMNISPIIKTDSVGFALALAY